MANKRRKVIRASSRFKKGFQSDEQRKAVMAMMMQGKRPGKVLGFRKAGKPSSFPGASPTGGPASVLKGEGDIRAELSHIGNLSRTIEALLSGTRMTVKRGTPSYKLAMEALDTQVRGLREHVKENSDAPKNYLLGVERDIQALVQMKRDLKRGRPAQWKRGPRV